MKDDLKREIVESGMFWRFIAYVLWTQRYEWAVTICGLYWVFAAESMLAYAFAGFCLFGVDELCGRGFLRRLGMGRS